MLKRILGKSPRPDDCYGNLTLTFVYLQLFTLVAELAPPSKRGLCVTFCASFWMVGSVFVALVGLLFLKNEADNGSTGNDENTEPENSGTQNSLASFLFEPVA